MFAVAIHIFYLHSDMIEIVLCGVDYILESISRHNT